MSFHYPKSADLDGGELRFARHEKRPPTAIYDYVDEEGQPLFRVLRFENPKRFTQQRFDQGSWVPGLEGTRRIPWNLPNVLRAIREGATVHLCEGEKDAGRLQLELANAGRADEVATTTPGGARSWRAEYARYFAGAQVVIHPDRDDEGQRYLREAAASLRAGAASIRVLQPRAGKDVSDHLDAGHGLADFDEVPIEQASPAHALTVALVNSTIGEMLCSAPPERAWVLPGLIPRGVAGIVAAQGGAGKSHMSIALAVELALGEGGWFGDFAVREPAGTIIVSAEDDRSELHRRLVAAIEARGDLDTEQRKSLARRVRLVDVTGTRVRVDMTELADGLARLVDEVEDCKLIILDPLSRLLPEGAELNSQEAAGEIHNAIDVIVRRTGCAVLVLHHVGKLHQRQRTDLSQAAATGSAQLVDLARLAINLKPLNEDEAAELGLEAVAGRFVAMGVSKSNYAPLPSDLIIFRRAGGGALVYEKVPSVGEREVAAAERRRAALIGVIRAMEQSVTKEQATRAAAGSMGRNRARDTWDALVAERVLVREGKQWVLAGEPAPRPGDLANFVAPLPLVSGAVH